MKDLNPLRHLERVCFGGDAWPILDLVGVLVLPGLVRLKASSAGRMVGFASGDPRPGEGLGWISTIGVLPEFRRQGVATALLHACETEMNFPVVRLTVRRSNDAAASFYFREGFRMVDVWPNYYFDGEDGLVMEKRRLKIC